MFADKPLPKPVSRRKQLPKKKHYWENCQISENSKNDIRTTHLLVILAIFCSYF
jgi:hypothetical protein